jgi:hypothetical protein
MRKKCIMYFICYLLINFKILNLIFGSLEVTIDFQFSDIYTNKLIFSMIKHSTSSVQTMESYQCDQQSRSGTDNVIR